MSFAFQGLDLLCVHVYSAGVVSARVTLTHNLGDDGVVFRGQTATFNCTIVVGNDTVITWSSAHYIGRRGVVLQLTSIDPPGSSTSNQQNPTTVATLINTTHSRDGVTTVTSSLQLVASAQYPTSNITCRANGHGRGATITFQTGN